MNATRRKAPAWAIIFAALALVVTTGIAGSGAAAPDAIANDNFTVLLDVPHGARIDYLRLFFYDASPANSQAWITTYNGQGAFADLTTLASSGAAGYGTTLSAYLGHVVNTETHSYVLNWRANQLGKTMRLCGMRVAYRVPAGAGWSSFYYFFVAGSTMQPRDSSTRWYYPGAGCVAVPYQLFLPLVLRS